MTQIPSSTPPLNPNALPGMSEPVEEGAPPTPQTIASPLPGSDPLANFGATHGLHPSVQQFAYADKNGGSGAGGKTDVAKGATEAKHAPARARTPEQIDRLAQNPGSAHMNWKTLSPKERDAVVEKMRQRYGDAFAQQFLDVVKSGKANVVSTYWQPGSGPSADDLKALGYRFAGKLQTGNAAFDVDVYVHPSGKTVHKDVSTYKFGSGGPEQAQRTGDPPAGGKKGPAADMPPYIDPLADRNKLFGKVVALRDGVDTAFGEGDVQLHEKGAVEIFLDGTGGKSYLFVPIKGHAGLYAAYGPDGKRMGDQGWRLPATDIPDRNADSVDD